MIFRTVALLSALSLIQYASTFSAPSVVHSRSHGANKLCSMMNVNNYPFNVDHRRLVRPLSSLTSLWVSTATETTKDSASEDDGDDIPLSSNPVSKFRKLKDIMWIREAVEDVTAAEFACSVEGSSEGEKDARLRRKRKRAVDYEKMLSNLDRRLADMVPGGDGTWELDQSKGMGRYAFSPSEREELLGLVLKTRQGLIEIIKGHSEDEKQMDGESDSGFGFELPEIRVDIPKEDDSGTSVGPKLYVRDDGTVDWDGALQDRVALKKFGGAVWARINGQTPDDLPGDDDSESIPKKGDGHGETPAVTAKIEDTPSIREAREELNRLQRDLQRETRAHKQLLSSGILEGQAVANVRLASLDPELRTKIRLSAEALHTMEQQVSYQNLVYELERIYTYLATELGNPSAKGYVPLQDRLNVAEFGLLEGQVESRSRELIEKGSLDADILAVITDQMTDFKRRLGIDYYVTGLTYDREAIQAWLADILGKTKSGLMFYVKGCQLFWDDLVYCSSLIARAVQGYTLKPREVRTIRYVYRRIFKQCYVQTKNSLLLTVSLLSKDGRSKILSLSFP
jgi:hypothetical protein